MCIRDRATVLNLLGLRFTNRIFEPVWNGENIESVAICLLYTSRCV